MIETDLVEKLREKTYNFTTHFNLSTLMTGDNYHSGEVVLKGITYYIVKYKGKVRVWDRPENYMAWVSGKEDYIVEIDI